MGTRRGGTMNDIMFIKLESDKEFDHTSVLMEVNQLVGAENFIVSETKPLDPALLREAERGFNNVTRDLNKVLIQHPDSFETKSAYSTARDMVTQLRAALGDGERGEEG